MLKYSSWFAAISYLLLAIFCKLKFVPLETNFALFGALAIFCGAHLRGLSAWLIPIGGFIIGDCLGEWLQVPGVYRYDFRAMLFNYAGLGAMIGAGYALRDRESFEWILGATFLGSLAYFFISNFGAWLDPLMKYDSTFSGLMNCYWMAIPFFRYTLASDLLFSLIFFGVYRMVLSYLGKQSVAPVDR